MHKKYTTADFVGFSIVGIVAAISALYIAFGWKVLGAFLWDPATASWVQAIGSIGAIVGAWWGVNFQLRRGDELRQRERKEVESALTKACYFAVQDAAETMVYISGRLRGSVGQHFRLRTERVEELQQTFRTLIAKDIPADALHGVLTVQRELAYCLSALRELATAHEVTELRAKNSERRAAVVVDVFAKLWEYHNPVLLEKHGKISPLVADPSQDFSDMEVG